ncbi:MAG: hypothetical protein RBT16_01930 [Desulfococcus multivorans]|uniref:hypothetical protein n=1 Tax=Desulfococcus sp. TaxID=2025834 RepID=UPI002A3E0DB1|nr:hypothetical protein [Desulfococcus multivorans]
MTTMRVPLTLFVRNLFALLPIVLAVLAAPVANAETSQPQEDPANVVTIIATRPIQDGNIASAKAEAIAAALAAAVDQGAMAIFSPEAIAREFKIYSATVTPGTEAFIENYKILGEASSGGYYRIMMQVTVSMDQLKSSLGKFQPAAGTDTASGESPAPGSVDAIERPRILFLLSEQSINDVAPRFWWDESSAPVTSLVEAAIARKAREAGFVVLEHGTTPPDVPVKAAVIFQPDLSNRDASEIGRIMGADVVIVGKAIVYAVSDTGAGGDPAYNATISVRAVQAENDREIASGFETAVRQHPNEIDGSEDALTAAGLQAAKQLIPAIASAWQDMARSSEGLTVTVTGTRNLGNFVRFRQVLRDLPGVRNLQILEIRADEAVIALHFEGDTQTLMDRLSGQTFELFTVEIRSVSEKALHIDLVPK